MAASYSDSSSSNGLGPTHRNTQTARATSQGHYVRHHRANRLPSLIFKFQPILVAYTWASANAAVSSDATGGPEENTVSHRYCDPAVVAITAWLALVTVSCGPALDILC